MTIRTYQPGDETAQVSIYNEAAAALPKFKPATLDEVRRRCRAADFDPGTRFYALEQGRPVAYITFQANGRVSLPWCRPGHERWAAPLFERLLEAMRGRGLTRAFAAYRGDWPAARDFFLAHGFSQDREMLNYVIDLIEMPTPAAKVSTIITPLTPGDLDALAEMGAGVLRVNRQGLEREFFRNPYYEPTSLFALRQRDGGKPTAIGVLVANPAYAAPNALDAMMPCFRLGAFGTEGLTTKRINGLFSFLVDDPRNVSRSGLDLLGHAAYLLQETQVETLAAQAPSDVPHLVRFYQQYFRPQGRFPLFERAL
jgi:hypothetical protein